MKPIINFDDFSKLDLRVGLVENCVKKEGSDKLLRLSVNFGQEGTRNILTGLAPWYPPEYFIGKEFIFILNLEPRKIMGEESQGMILATDTKKPSLLVPRAKVTPGIPIR